MNRIIVGIGFLVALAMAAGGGAAQRQTPGSSERAGKAPEAVVNLNTATAADLESLPGIGAKTAQRILEYRQKNGGFKKIEENLDFLETDVFQAVFVTLAQGRSLRAVSGGCSNAHEISHGLRRGGRSGGRISYTRRR